MVPDRITREKIANDKPTNDKPTAERKRRWYQFHLWHLFVFVGIMAVPCSWLACKLQRVRDQRAIIEEITIAGGEVQYDFESDYRMQYVPDPNRVASERWRNLFGRDFVAEVVGIAVYQESLSNAQFEKIGQLTSLRWLCLSKTHATDADVAHLRSLSKLEMRELRYTDITDAAIPHLAQLANLEVLDLTGTEITDAGLEHFRSLKRLEALYLRGTSISPEAARRLQNALPACSVQHEELP